MAISVSVVINTFNEAENIGKLIRSLDWADEVIICDMRSDDETASIAKKMGAKVYFYKRSQYVEPARNFAISKAKNDWVFLLDADEEVPGSLVDYIKKLNYEDNIVCYNIGRKNIIFGKWMQASFWWPDYQPRLFQKKYIVWQDSVHSKPEIHGNVVLLPPEEGLSIIHNNYQTISQFIFRMDRYSNIQADELIAKGYEFDWKDLISKPISEFLSRYFAKKGFRDGLHGLALSLLQAFSFLVLYLKVWQKSDFKQDNIKILELQKLLYQKSQEVDYWFDQELPNGNLLKKIVKKLCKSL